ncbi:cytochrome P450 [Podospora appendiculata]|uniref:Cytochrome P450 n=1 Tax=Podospora appendiculata TaxID=314037 RepID=A0AAE0WZ29_9PEZI|nr:cytochrome P450 [Podospora appendiculata]
MTSAGMASEMPRSLDIVYVVCGGLFLTILLLALCQSIYNIFFHPLASYPGPLHYRACELPRLFQEWRGNTVHRWAELHDKYGDVVRIAPNQLSYISVSAWRDIYGARGTLKSGGNEMLKEELVFPGDDFEFFHPAKPMISCDGVNHTRHRRAVGNAFSDRALRAYEPVLVQYINKMMDRLQQHADGTGHGSGLGNAVNIMDWFHFVMFDITSALVFGKSFGNLDNGRYHPWVARVFPGMKLIAWSMVVAAIPGLGRLVSWLLPKRMVTEAKRHMQSIVDMTESRRTSILNPPPHRHADFMDYILPNIKDGSHGRQEQHKESVLSTEELYLNSQLLCIAGSETTASLLAGAVYFLSRPESAQHKDRLLSELRDIFASEDDITPHRLNKAMHLTAVLHECLRLYPPGAINMPRTVPPGGASIDGRYVPGGAIVGIAQYAAYRSATHWTDPLVFAPERWLAGTNTGNKDSAGDVGRYANDRREVFKPFSYGPRNCIGQNLAMAECRLIVARLFWRFEVEVLPGQEDWVYNQRTYLSWEKPPLMVKLRRRQCLRRTDDISNCAKAKNITN